MKQLLLLLFTSGCFAVSSQTYSENQLVRIEPNGVQVHESAGLEGFVVTSTETPLAENGINNWNIEQCEEVITYIKVKAQEKCSLKEGEAYTEQLQLLEERVRILKSSNK